MKTILIGAAIALNLFNNQSTTEVLKCEVVPLEEYGFIQISEHQEYVCQNSNNVADFVVIEDMLDQYKVGDNLRVELNKHGELLEMNKIVGSDKHE